MKTTLKQIRAAGPCGLRLDEDGERIGYLKLKRYLGKGYGDDTPISIATVIDSNGLDDALWCLRAVKGHQREMRLFAVWCARRVEPLMADKRSKNALTIAERHANGVATDAELAAARDAARDAVWAARGARAAARAARAAAKAAAWDAAQAAAWDARDAASDAQADELRRVCACIDAGEDPYPLKGIDSDSGARPAAQEAA